MQIVIISVMLIEIDVKGEYMVYDNFDSIVSSIDTFANKPAYECAPNVTQTEMKSEIPFYIIDKVQKTFDKSDINQYEVVLFESQIMDPYNDENVCALINDQILMVHQNALKMIQIGNVVTLTTYIINDDHTVFYTDNVPNTSFCFTVSVTDTVQCKIGDALTDTHSILYKFCNINRELLNCVEVPYVFEYNNQQYCIDRDCLDKLETDDRLSYTSWTQRLKEIEQQGIDPIKLQLIKIGSKFHLRLMCNHVNNYLDWMYVMLSGIETIPVVIIVSNMCSKTELYQFKPIDDLNIVNDVLKPDITVN